MIEKWKGVFSIRRVNDSKKRGFSLTDYATERRRNVKGPFPIKDIFYNNLRQENCTQEEYDNAKLVYLETGCQTPGKL